VYLLDKGELKSAMLHTCASCVKRDCIRTTRPFLTKVSSFPWVIRHGERFSQSVAVKDSEDEKKPTAYSNASLLSRAAVREDEKKPVAVSNASLLSIAALRVGRDHRESPEDRMTRLTPDETGLPMHINISVAQPLEFPCIKVNKTTKKELPLLEDMFSVDIPADPYYGPLVRGDPGEITQSDLRRVYKFIMLNRETLLVFWYQLEECEYYMDKLKSI